MTTMKHILQQSCTIGNYYFILLASEDGGGEPFVKERDNKTAEVEADWRSRSKLRNVVGPA